ncbi:PREDICTED: kinesin-like protein KIF20B isoform X2 [Priapulus caudatus]|nr:PREDICTED: kinesin-like protein KIF20B isoform X2 [Priapulus caudatus]
MASGKAPLSPNGDDADVCLFGSDENIPMNIDQPLRRHLASEFTTVVKPSEEEVDALDSTSANLQPGQEHMKVFLRIRPFTENELRQKESQNILKVDNSNVLSVNAPKDSVTYKNYQHGGGRMTYKFTFSKIFGPECSQKTLFDEAMGGIVKDTVDGQNCLLFTYGVTNAGKTYTIQGNQSDEGILPRSLDVIFNSVVDKQYESMNLKPRCFQDVVRLSEEQEASEAAFKRGILRMANNDEPESSVLIATSTLGGSQMTLNSTSDLSSTSAASQMLDVTKSSDVTQLLGEVDSVLEEARVSVETQGQIRFSIWVSYTEIYNELVYDLLAPMATGMDRKRPSLKLAEDKSGNVYVKGLKEVKVNSADEAYKVLCIGKKNLQVATTKLNHSSSRSHCIFTVKILRVVDKDRPHVCRVSKLSFCDLAGSERYSKTQNTGQRLKEATNINTSLLTLGRCIHSLRFNQLHKDHPNMVPYRDSKLTKLLQSFFSGKGKASMIVNVSPCASYFDETLHGLKFSAIAKQVTVQQVKEPEMKPPKRPYRHRSSKPAKISLMLKAAPPPRTRETLAWEEAPAAKRRLQEAAKIPLPEDDDDDLDEEEEEEEEDNDEENEELRELVAQLTQQLKEEKKKLLLTETRIREEVSSEFAAQLIDIENQRAEDMREERHAADEYAEKRLELFSQSVKKSRKRMRIRDDDDDDTALGAQLQLANAKAQEQDRALDELREQLREASSDIGKLKGALKASACERAKTIEENSKLQFRLSDANTTIGLLQEKEQMLEVAEATVCDLQQQLIETSQLVTANASASNEVCKPQEKDSLNSSSDSFLHSEIVNQLQKQLEEARDNVERQEAEIKELNEMLEEAGETFEQKEEEIGKLKAALSEPDENEQALAELAQLSEESKLALQEAKEMLGSRNNYIRELEAQLRRLQDTQDLAGEKVKIYERMTSKILALEAQCAIVTKQRDDNSAELAALVAERDRLQEQQVALLERVETAEARRNSMQRHLDCDAVAAGDEVGERAVDVNVAVEALQTSKDTQGALVESLQTEMTTRRADVERLEAELRSCVERQSELERETSELSIAKEWLEAENRELRQENEASLQKVSQLTQANEASLQKVSQLTQENEPSLQKVSQLTQENEASLQKVSQLTQENEASLQKVSQLTQEHEVHKEKVAQLTQENEAFKEQVSQLTQENETSSEKVSQLTQENKTSKEQVSQLTQENETSREKVSQLTQENETSREKVSQLTQENKTSKEQVSQLTQENETSKEQVSQLTQENETSKEQVSQLTQENEASREKMSQLTLETETCREKVSHLTQENEAVREQLSRHERDGEAEIETRIRELETRVQETEDARRRDRVEGEQEIMGLTEEVEKLTEEGERLRACVALVEEERKDYMEEGERMLACVARVEEERDGCREEGDRLQACVARLEEERDECREEGERLQACVARAEKERDECRERMDVVRREMQTQAQAWIDSEMKVTTKVQELLAKLGNERKANADAEVQKCEMEKKLEVLRQDAAEKEKLEEDNRQLSSELAEIKNAVEQFQRKITELDETIEAKEATLREHVSTMTTLQQQVHALQKAAEEMEVKLRENVSMGTDRAEGLSQNITDLMEDVKVKDSTLKEQASTITELKTEVDVLQKCVEEKEVILSEKCKAANTAEDLSKQIADLMEVADVKAATIKQHVSVIAELKQQVETLQKDVEEKEVRIRENAILGTNTAEERKKKNADLMEEIKVKDSSLKELASANTELKNQVEALHTDIKEKEVSLRESKTLMQEQVIAREEIGKKMEVLQMEIDANKNSVTGKDEEVRKLLATSNDLRAQLEILQKESGEKEASLREAISVADVIQKQVEEHEAKLVQENTDLLVKASTVEKLQSQLECLQRGAEKNEATLKEKDEALQEKVSTVAEMLMENQQLEDRLAEMKCEHDKARCTVEELESTTATLERSQNRLTEEIGGLRTEIEGKKADVSGLQTLAVEQEQTMEMQEKAINDKAADIKRLLDELGSVTEKYEQLQKRQTGREAAASKSCQLCRELQVALDDNNKELSELEHLYSVSKKELGELQERRESDAAEKLSGLSEELAGKEKELEALSRELRTKQRQIEKLREDLDKLRSQAGEKEAERDATLQKWKEERNELVGKLETVLKTQQAELRELRARQKETEDNAQQDNAQQDNAQQEKPEVVEATEQPSEDNNIEEKEEDRLEIDVTPVQAQRPRKQRTRKKRKSEEIDPDFSGVRRSTRSRRTTRQSTRASSSPTTTTAADDDHIQNEVCVENTTTDSSNVFEVESSAASTTRSSKRRRKPLSKIAEILHNSPVNKTARKVMDFAHNLISPEKDKGKEFASPELPSQTTVGKKKRKLYNASSSTPLEMSPMVFLDQPEKTDAHQILKQRLRTRKR